ncbi:hypothetical protein V9T40_000954 [Parthenolecanium corni]|uniref:Small-subunit processome Utp12 domain-containing protein n=1 Tax=Parthenolecanium corni TaxID=536013 RepID=A0AAN9TCL1_9HEMI
MAGKNLASFSNTGRYYAHVCDDGKLRIWDVVSCVLKQEFTPDVHLTSPYTDLVWISTSKKVNLSSSNRKRKSSGSEIAASENENLLIGSKSGDIYLYSVASFSIINTFSDGHSCHVNSISWCRQTPDQFISCSEDQHVILWSLEDYSVKKKWKCGKFSTIALSDDGLSFVSAKKEIQWWDISGEKETLRKSFIGHSTDVHCLNFVRICGEPCVLSAAVGNRLLHAWLLKDDEDRSALAVFALDDALVSISVLSSSSSGLSVLASSRTGVLHLYTCTINGKKHRKPAKPKLTIQIAAESEDSKAKVEQIPIVGSAFCDENSAHIAYGGELILSFEKLQLKTTEKSMIIVRQDPQKKSVVNKEQSLNKVLPTSSCKNVQYVSSDMVNGFSGNSSKKPQKRPNNAEKSYDVPLEQRLENLSVDIPSTSNAPTSESLVHLLLQGLKSKDPKILEDVLSNSEESVIKTTISRLPVEAVLPLSTELISVLKGRRTNESESALKWLRTLVILHAAHLVSNPDITEVFAPLFPLIESKLNVIGPLYKLAGRLDLMIQQIKHRTDKSEQSLQSVSLQPKLIYQDEDSEEEYENEIVKEEVAVNNDNIVDDSDDHWDEMSELDDSGQEQSQEEMDVADDA